MIQYVHKPRRRGKKSRDEYYGRYKLPGQKLKDVPLHTTDKRIADKRLEAIVREEENELADVVLPRSVRDGAVKSLQQHVEDFVADLKAKGRKKSYYALVKKRVTVLCQSCGWNLVKDITPDNFTAWRACAELKAKTLNDYLGAITALLAWMVRCGRLIANPLAGFEPVSVIGRQEERRALTHDEVRRLLKVHESRRVVYLTALMTGLRRGELRQLRWGDLHLDAPRPFLNARPSTTKNGKTACIWLRQDLVAELKRIRPAAAAPGQAVFRVPKPETWGRDFDAAGIVRKDSRGHLADFHALRKTFCTYMARGAVAPRVAMEAMRHSDMRLTAKTYTDVGLLPTADVMDKLPQFLDEPAAAVATGTEGGEVSKMRSQISVASGPCASSAVANSSGSTNTKTPAAPGFSRDLTPSVVDGQNGDFSEGDGARTRNHRIDSPVEAP
jgi:integrase